MFRTHEDSRPTDWIDAPERPVRDVAVTAPGIAVPADTLAFGLALRLEALPQGFQPLARKDKSTKEPGRLKQMWQVFQMTRRYDDRALLYIVGGIVLPILAGIAMAVFLSGGNVFTMVLWIVAGVLAGVLLGLIILGRRAERAAYSQIEGQPGAVGAVLRSSLKRSWRGSEMPIAVNGKTQDAVYRATGRGGVVLISEGPKTRTQRMVDEERRKVTRVLPNVPITAISVGLSLR